MNNYRIYVEKLKKFQVEAKSLQSELNLNLGLSLKDLRYINVYDLFNFSKELLEKSRYQVFGEIVTDAVVDELDLTSKKYIAIEYLPGQFDQRASSAIDCVKLIDPNADINIRSGKIVILDDDTSDENVLRIKKYLINAVEAREKDLNVLSDLETADIKPVEILEGFTQMTEADYAKYCKKQGLAMNKDDLACVVEYFKKEGRDPWETELRILDTYWSDHCRHTTFNTILTDIKISKSFMKAELEESLDLYYKIRKNLKRENKKLCLMDLACIGARYLKKKGVLDNLEESEENNACSIFVTVDVDGKDQKWLLQFKNETHNHPTEIEPFGGASTCLGGAIRDPLSGRAYVYQAMRVTGAGDIYLDVKDTMVGKLPQRIISTKAAAGYSSYGNQIGLATTHVREVFHDDYVAKRLEVGAVVGAVKADVIRRESPAPGDIILLLGGRTGRDGIGGATGSSKEHTTKSIEVCSSEVQKGNAPEERKISHLFRRPEVTKLIKKSNDFGAGGVSVAIGELADGLDIMLDNVPTKYSGLNATELAISESQERMAVVIEPKSEKKFIKFCKEENIEVTRVATVTADARLVMHYKGRKIVDISREFIDSAGADHFAKATISAVENINPFVKEEKPVKEKVLDTLNDNNVVSQKGLIEMFDATIGASTVLMPFGGKYQKSETQVSVQKLPVKDGFTNTASIMAYGYNPYLAKWSPYHGAEYAVIEACAKVVAAGARYDKMRFSYQEYFERMTKDASWGKPLAALLGALKMQVELGLPSIGGKDSMSGTFQDISVPPMLMAFGITTVNANTVISTDLKKAGNKLYLIKHNENENYTPNIKELKKNFDYVSTNIENKNIVSAYALSFGGVIEAISKMSFGNMIGFDINYDEKLLDAYNYGSILVETTCELDYKNAIYLGETLDNANGIINGVEFTLAELEKANTDKFNTIYKDKAENDCKMMKMKPYTKKNVKPLNNKDEVVAYFPVFPGTNCDYDTSKAFKRAGAKIVSTVFKNLTSDDIFASIEEMANCIDNCDIFVLSGGFSAGDEPDGSGKFIANVLNQASVRDAIHRLIDRKGLILGICNGFQALVKSGLLPYGRLGMVTKDSPTLFRNDINRHISQMVSTKVMTTASPWLQSYSGGEIHSIAVSHGEGKFVVSDKLAKKLYKNGQVAFQYVDADGNATAESPYNPNGSSYAIEGIISKDGLILGKMGHSERYEENLFKNIDGNKYQDIFENAVNYFKK
ncbi:MAG: phosphoribosylformylglycinamidine synthase [Erysipelotrichaceae bacterium]|nr:phosphoribosylformylglycinamidine synthase [Erysipelotrichaceae bacterium]